MTEDLLAEIRPLLCGAFGDPLRHLTEIDSTNSEAIRWAAEGAPEGAVVVADSQTAGRGRWSRSWISAPGASLTFSVVLRPPWPGDRLDLLTTTVGVAVAEALREIAEVDAHLKWPNDVTVGGKKLAGILVESQSDGGRVASAIAGIGINLGALDWPEELGGRVVTLSEVSASVPSRARVLAAVLSWLEPLYHSLRTDAGALEIVRLASERSAVLGHDVELTFADGRVDSGIARRLLPSGALEVEFADRVEEVRSAEITRSTSSPG